MDMINAYLERLRKLIPGRTLGIYLLGNALLLTLVQTPSELPAKFAWLILLINGLCLAFNFLGGMFIDKKPWLGALISSIALLLLALCQRFYGPLAAFGIDTQAAYIVVGFVAALYVLIVGAFYSDKLDGEAARAAA
jgi:hypothetical protein